MQSVRGIKYDSRRSRAGKRRRDFGADMSRFSHAQDDYFATGIDSIFNKRDGANKTLAQPVAQPLQLEDFDIDDANSLFKVIHRAI